MRLAAGLACFALLAGCGGSTNADTLTFAPDLAEGFAALPRIAADTPQARAINARLDSRDAGDRQTRSDCLAMKPHNDNVEWSRSVSAPMTGPRFVAIVMTRGGYCGGAHGDWEQSPLVFDLATGTPIDWKAWLPADMATPMVDESAGESTHPAFLTSPSLKSWFAARALEGFDAHTRAGCADLYGREGQDSWGLIVWPDGRAGGLTFQNDGLAYAEMGCQAQVTMPLSELGRRGVASTLIEAIKTAHDHGGWRDFPPEPPLNPEQTQ